MLYLLEQVRGAGGGSGGSLGGSGVQGYWLCPMASSSSGSCVGTRGFKDSLEGPGVLKSVGGDPWGVFQGCHGGVHGMDAVGALVGSTGCSGAAPGLPWHSLGISLGCSGGPEDALGVLQGSPWPKPAQIRQIGHLLGFLFPSCHEQGAFSHS